jgi:hypothetical protein
VQDARIAPELRRVAKDETEHAALSWQVHAWALRQLSPDARGRIREAMAQAVVQLEQDVGAPVPGPCLEAGLLPAPEVARELFRDLTARLAS